MTFLNIVNIEVVNISWARFLLWSNVREPGLILIYFFCFWDNYDCHVSIWNHIFYLNYCKPIIRRNKNNNRKTLWLLLMYGVQLSRGHRETTRIKFAFYHCILRWHQAATEDGRGLFQEKPLLLLLLNLSEICSETSAILNISRLRWLEWLK